VRFAQGLRVQHFAIAVEGRTRLHIETLVRYDAQLRNGMSIASRQIVKIEEAC
jgi:hypothetical protein